MLNTVLITMLSNDERESRGLKQSDQYCARWRFDLIKGMKYFDTDVPFQDYRYRYR